MSIVAVHGPQTFGASGAAGGGSGQVIQNAQIKATANMTNGLSFTVEPVNTGRIAADYDWSFTQVSSPVTQADTKTPFTVTFATAGSKTITLTVAAGAGPPAGGVYTLNVTAVSGPRSVEEEGGEPQALEAGEAEPELAEPEYFDPSEHTVDEVVAFATDNPEQAADILAAEQEGKNRTTLVSQLEDLIPFDPADYTVDEVVTYAEENPEQVQDLIAAEEAGKNRTTLLAHLRSL